MYNYANRHKKAFNMDGYIAPAKYFDLYKTKDKKEMASNIK